MEEITYLNEEIDRVVDLLNVLKSRYFFLRAKYDIELGSQSKHPSKDIQNDNQYASYDLQSFVMLELHLLEYACTYGIFSMNMYATRLTTNLIENDKDPDCLKQLKQNVQSLIETNKEIKNLSINSYEKFHSYTNSFMVYANVLNEISILNTIQSDESIIKKKKDKLMKKMSKINLMATIITFFVSDNITDYRTENGRTALNIALKYRTPRTLEYYTEKIKLK